MKPQKTQERLKGIQRPKTTKRTKEQLSEQEIKELMGIHRDTYTRRRGAVRKR